MSQKNTLISLQFIGLELYDLMTYDLTTLVRAEDFFPFYYYSIAELY
jgi:hypothetical protein